MLQVCMCVGDSRERKDAWAWGLIREAARQIFFSNFNPFFFVEKESKPEAKSIAQAVQVLFLSLAKMPKDCGFEIPFWQAQPQGGIGCTF